MPPWQWLSLVGAVLTAVIYFRSDAAKIAWDLREKRDPPERGPDTKAATRLLQLTRGRDLCTLLWLLMLLAAGYTALALTVDRAEPGVAASRFSVWRSFILIPAVGSVCPG